MIRRATLPKVLLLLAFFVFFSAGTIHFVESPDRPDLFAAVERNYQLDFEDAASKGLRLNLKSALVCNYDNGEVIYDVESVGRTGTSSEFWGVTLTLTYEDGSSSTRTTYFVLEDGEWKHRFGQEENDLFMPDATFEEFVEAQG